jgi:hypothetical protein
VKIKPIMRVIEKIGACRDDILDIVEDTVTFTHCLDSFLYSSLIDDDDPQEKIVSL